MTKEYHAQFVKKLLLDHSLLMALLHTLQMLGDSFD
jgi:hypothetical protein